VHSRISSEKIMRQIARFLCWSPLYLSLILLAACPPQQVRVNMTLNAAANINPDSGGRPLSVVVRVYQLKDKGRLASAEYSAILKSDTQALAGDLLENQERTIQPGSQEVMEIRANPAATYLGVVALFRNPTGDNWRKIIPITGKLQKLTLSLSETSLEVVSTGK
jgi:type VI secretion system protein VasD